jgi:hypothetical protein
LQPRTIVVFAGVLLALAAAMLYRRAGNDTAAAPAGMAGASHRDGDSADGASSASWNAPVPASSENAGHVMSARDQLGKLREAFARQTSGAQPEANKHQVPAKRGGNDVDDTAPRGDPQEVTRLERALLSDADPEQRASAAVLLSCEEGPESLNTLLEAMGDADHEVRLAVVEALADRSDELNPEALGPATRDSDREVRLEAVDALGDMAEDKPSALKMLREALNDPDREVRSTAARQLAEAGASASADETP